MAGHSQFKNIMYRKGAQDKKRAGIFGKLVREITVAARDGGPDPEGNPRLRSAISAARAENMPKDNIERAIQKGSGAGGASDLAEIRYEGYGPGGTAIVVEAVTDNRNRTAAEIRALFSKLGGSLGEANSVAYQFDRAGIVRYPSEVTSGDAALEHALEAGALDVIEENEQTCFICEPSSLHAVAGSLAGVLGDAVGVALEWRPQSLVGVSGEKAKTLLRLLQALDEHDDVQRWSCNCEVSDHDLEQVLRD